MKWIKKLLSILLVLLLLLPVFFLFGNPISYGLIFLRGNAYLKDTYPDLDVRVSEIRYDFKHGYYTAKAASPTSADTYFRLYPDWFGNISGDTYTSVTSGGNTAGRLSRAYDDLVTGAVTDSAFPFDFWLCSGELASQGGMEYFTKVCEDGSVEYYTLAKDYNLDPSTLELDMEYDIPALGADHGRIIIYIYDENVSTDRAAEILLDLKNYFDTKGVSFHGIRFNLMEPPNEAGQNVGAHLTLYDFLYSDIYADGLTDRVEAAHQEYQAHIALQDAQME